MKKIFGAVSLSVLGLAVFPCQGEVVHRTSAAAPAASGYDPVQRCLDLVQLNLAGKIAPALHVASRAVQSPPKDLPIHCLAGHLNEIKSALKNQIENCERKSAEEKAQTFQFGCRMVKNEDYCLNANTEMLKIASLPNMNYVTFVNRAAREFDWYESNGSQGNDGKFKTGTTRLTGYYSPTAVEAAADPSDAYPYPIYAAPDGLTYFEILSRSWGRAAVSTRSPKFQSIGALAIKTAPTPHSPLASRSLRAPWMGKAGRSLISEVFMMFLEGAGSVNLRLKDGSIESVILNFAGKNARPNNMIGDVLKCENKKIKGSLAAYYARHPNEAYRDTVHYNPSTVFYQPGVSYEGVDHIPITPNASIATDPTSIPTGTVTLINVPATNACNTSSSMTVAQDIGGRIKGAHVDRYTGAGPVAGTKAESFNDSGLIFMAVPKGAGSPVRDCASKTAN